MLKELDIPPVYTGLAVIATIILAIIGNWIGGILGARFWGGLLIILGIALFVWSVILFREMDTTIVPRQKPSILITEGPFLYTRNPIYLSMVMVTLGVGVFSGVVIAYIPAIALAVFLDKNYVVPEERKLVEAFGDAASQYIEETPAWIGFIKN